MKFDRSLEPSDALEASALGKPERSDLCDRLLNLSGHNSVRGRHQQKQEAMYRDDLGLLQNAADLQLYAPITQNERRRFIPIPLQRSVCGRPTIEPTPHLLGPHRVS